MPFPPTNLTMHVGDTQGISAGPGQTWASSDPSVVSVNLTAPGFGYLKAEAVGTAVVTETWQGQVINQINVTVVP